MMQPVRISIPWRDPLDSAHGLLVQPWALALVGRGSHPLARWSYLALAPVRTHLWHEGDAGDPFAVPRTVLAGLDVAPDPQGAPFQGGWAGLLGYELGRAFETLPWPGGGVPDPLWPHLALGLYDTVAAFDAQTRTASITSLGLRPDLTADPLLARARAEQLAALIADAAPVERHLPASGAVFQPARTRGQIESAVARTVGYIRAGDIYQANISRRLGAPLPLGCAPRDLFHALMSRHPAPLGACLMLEGLAVVSHTPERFITASAPTATRPGQLETRPIKGTRPRWPHDTARDAAEADALLASAKDRSENLMIVDLMRNDLARVCTPGSVRVPRLFGLESFSTVHHLVSDITGQLKPGLGPFDALAAAFPPGSVTGAPKVRAMEIIAELEGEPRGPYCGAMAWIGWDGAMDSSVLIRTAALTQSPGGSWSATVRAGGGIVADSEPAAEFDEMVVKGRAFEETLAALGAVPGHGSSSAAHGASHLAGDEAA
jgi:para-aminobenzoate synthetase component I